MALTFPSHPLHESATEAFIAASNDGPALFCRATELSFLRLISTPAVQLAYGSQRISNREALKCIDAFAALPRVSFCKECDETRPLWRRLAAVNTPSPKIWMDAYLAAVAISLDIELTTGDRDFINYDKDGLKLRLLS